MAQDIVIIGASGFAKEVMFVLERNNKILQKWNIKGFIDNDKVPDTKILGYPVLGNDEWLIHQKDELCAVCAIGNPNLRKKIIQKYSQYNHISFPSIMDNSAIISPYVTIGKGSIICAGCILTVDIEIGEFAIINLDCTIGHDAKIGDYTTLYPSVNVSGNVNIGFETEIGTGTNIIQGITITSDVIIGAGSVVIRNIEEKCTMAGNPAKRIG